MRKLICLALLSLALCLPSCATYHSATWAYGIKSSVHSEPNDFSERAGLRPIVGLPLLIGSFAWDVFTLPIQAMFGVWPYWGEASQHFKPNDKRV